MITRFDCTGGLGWYILSIHFMWWEVQEISYPHESDRDAVYKAILESKQISALKKNPTSN